jgi:hypothetical protein
VGNRVSGIVKVEDIGRVLSVFEFAMISWYCFWIMSSFEVSRALENV